MKKLILILLLVLPFNAFANTYSKSDIQKIKLTLKSKEYSGYIIHQLLNTAIEKRTNWDIQGQIDLYNNLIPKLEKIDNSTYNKLTKIFIFGRDELLKKTTEENKKIENQADYSKENAILDSQSNWSYGWTANYWNEWALQWHWSFSDEEIRAYWKAQYEKMTDEQSQRSTTPMYWYWWNNWYLTWLESISNRFEYWEVLYKWPSDSNYLIYDEALSSYKTFVSMYTSWWILSKELEWTKIRLNSEKILKSWYTERDDFQFLLNLWYRIEDWNLVYKDSLNIHKEHFTNLDKLNK